MDGRKEMFYLTTLNTFYFTVELFQCSTTGITKDVVCVYLSVGMSEM